MLNAFPITQLRSIDFVLEKLNHFCSPNSVAFTIITVGVGRGRGYTRVVHMGDQRLSKHTQ